MLGRFLELAIATGDTSGAWQRWQDLGFAPATAGEVWSYSYGVVTCEGLAVGFHAGMEEPLALFFVKQDVAALHRGLTMFGFDVEQVRLGEDVFNELRLREPGGLMLRVIEARTFSPPAELPASTRPGRFRAISLPCDDLVDARVFWEHLGAEVTDIEQPWQGVAIGGTPLAYHLRGDAKKLMLVFEGNNGLVAMAVAARPSPEDPAG